MHLSVTPHCLEGTVMTEIDKEMGDAAEALLEAAQAYYRVMQKKRLAGGCIWLTDKDGAMVVFTRGEYRHRLLRNIGSEFDAGLIYNFGVAAAGQHAERTDE